MSHGKLRAGSDCLNCGARVHGRYCHVCGQENIETHETLWGLITHFVYDITHFDGKFFTTLRLLLLRPGFLTTEYKRGRRASYLHPIKMYVFTSAVFFLLFFSVETGTNAFSFDLEGLPAKRAYLLQQLQTEKDSLRVRMLQDSLHIVETNLVALEEMKLAEPDPSLPDSLRRQFRKRQAVDSSAKITTLLGNLPATEQQYLNSQASLPAHQRHGWMKRYVIKKLIHLNAKFAYNPRVMLAAVSEKFLHSLPKMMFVSMPIMALFLSLLYLRRKQSGYVDHGIFIVHGYIALYFFIVLLLGLNALRGYVGNGIVSFLTMIVSLYVFYYYYKGMRIFFQQARAKTMLKFALLLVLSFVLFAMLSIVFVVNSFLQI